jgi:hypothetical protein
MRLKTRKIVLLVFFLAFTVTAPLVILYTAGFSYDWTKGKVVKTGILKLSTKPSGATITVNEQRMAETTPASLFRMLPGEYAVSMKKDGYLAWSKTLVVKSGETTFSRDVSLFRDAGPVLAARMEWSRCSWSPDGQSASVLNESGGFMELTTYSAQTSKSSVLARFSLSRYDQYAMSWSPTGNQLLLMASGGGASGLFLYSLPSGEVESLGEEMIGLNRLSARWSLDGSLISAVTSAGAYAINPLEGSADLLLLSPKVLDAAIKGRDVLLLVSEGDDIVLVKRANGGLSESEKVTALPYGRYGFVSVEGRYLMVADREKTVGYLIDYSDGGIVMKTDATDVAWERRGGEGRAILFNSHSVYLVDPASSSRELLTRLGAEINSCSWHSDGQHAIIVTSNYVTGMEIDDHGSRSWYLLAKMEDINAARLDDAGKKLLFFGSVGNQRGIFERPL